MKRFALVLLVFAGLCCPAGAESPSPVLVHFSMESDGTKHLSDSGPLHLGGDLKNIATFAPGKTGKALHFDGKIESLQLESHWAIDNLLQRFTLSVWIKPQVLPGGHIAYIVSKRPGWWVLTPFALGLGSDGRLRAACNDGEDHWIQSGEALALGEWHHVALTFEADKQFTMYVDGQVQPETARAGRLRGNAEPLALGYVKGGDFPGGNYQPYQGELDELSIYPVALTAAQVMQEMKGKLATRPAEVKEYPSRGMDEKEIPAEVRAAPAADAPLECEIVFDQQPKAKGMWFQAGATQAREVEVDGVKTWCRVSETALGVPWGRSFKFVITDPRFKNGQMPVCDMEIVYLAKAWAGVDAIIDAKNGSRKAGGGWHSPKWTTLRVSIDDAWFGARDHGNSDRAMLSDGFDLRINGYTQDLLIRSIKIFGRDRSDNIQWDRMLRLSGMQTDSGLLALERKAAQPIRYLFDNISLKNATLSWTWHATDYSGKVVQRASGTTTVPKEGKGSVEVKFDASALPLGPYLMQFDAAVDNNGKSQPLIKRSSKIGIISSARIEKAAAGEFLYGLANTVDTPLLYPWCDLMGVDILRGGGLYLGDPANQEENRRVVRESAEHGVQMMPLIDPPQDGSMVQFHEGMDPADRAARLKTQGAHLEAFAREFAGKITFYELGNEPDLRGFYHGPIEEYADSFKTMRQYVKKGNPAAIVMTGGLCFFGSEGDPRARKLVSMLGRDDIDAWAYHAHGPGSATERFCYERMRDAAAKAGDGREKTFYLETESGQAVDPGSPGELLQQARTCVQKTVYSQSNPTLAFFWFSLLMGDSDAWYTTTEGFAGMEPRPALLTYRNMVERLRHLRFDRLLDLKATEVEGYLFQGAGGRKALVAWSNRPAMHDLSIRLDAPDAAKVAQHDMFGNAQPARLLGGGVVSLTVGVDPVFLSWTSSGSLAEVRAQEPTLGVEVNGPMFAGAAAGNGAYVIVRNTLREPMKATLEVQAVSRLPISVTPARLEVEVAPGESKRVPVALKVGQAQRPLRLPRWWRVFPNVRQEEVDLTRMTSIPVELPGLKGGSVRGTDVLSEGGRIDINRIGGASVGKEPAVLMTSLYVPQDTVLKVASGSDWWMAWYLNGQRLYDTLETGNGAAASTLKHSFDLPLKAGNNTVAVLVLSGMAGWNLSFGTDKEIGLRDSGGIDPDRLVCRLMKDGKELTQQVVSLEIEQPLPVGGVMAADLEAWRLIEPVAVMEGSSITNLHEKFPDGSKWYKGPDDLSAIAWVSSSADTVTFAVAVKDDKFVAPSAVKLAEGDALQLRVTDDGGKLLLQLAAGLVEGKVVMQQTGNSVQGVESAIDQKGNLTLYRITAPRAVIGSGIARLHVNVMDSDEGYLKQLAKAKSRGGEEGIRFLLP